MAEKSFLFNSYLIEKNQNGEYVFPVKVLELTEKECSQKCDDVRAKIFLLFKNLPKCQEPEYKIFLEGGKPLDLLKPLKEQIDIEQNKPDFYLATKEIHMIEAFEEMKARHNNEKNEQKKVLEQAKIKLEQAKIEREKQEKKEKLELEQAKIEREKQEKTDMEIALLAELSKKLTDPIIFRRVMGKDVLEIMNSQELKRPKPHNFSEKEFSNIEQMIKVFNQLQKKHSIANEAGTMEQVSFIIVSALCFIDTAFVQKEYLIKPFLEFKRYDSGIERKADSVVYKEVLPKIICFSEMKFAEYDLSQGLMQNADQMRAFCLCNEKKKTAGIVSNGVYWYFTKYEIMDLGQNDKFKVSERFIVLKPIGKMGFFEMGEEALEFFTLLIGFIEENMNSIA